MSTEPLIPTEFKPQQDVLELDLALWRKMQEVARLYPTEMSEQLSLTPEAVKALAIATDKQLCLLSSGIILSFQLTGNDWEYLSSLNSKREVEFLEGSAVTSAYWDTVKQVANTNPDVATQVFGLSKALVESIAAASVNQIKVLSLLDAPFKIRFSSQLLLDILLADEKMRLLKLLQKRHMEALAA